MIEKKKDQGRKLLLWQKEKKTRLLLWLTRYLFTDFCLSGNFICWINLLKWEREREIEREVSKAEDNKRWPTVDKERNH